MKKILIKSNNNKIKLPYILIIPDNYDKNSHLIVELSGLKPTNKSITEQINDGINRELGEGMDYMLHLMEKELNYPIIIPIIPRIPNFYTTYLSSAVIQNDFSKCNISKEEKELLSNIPEQLKYMIEESIENLGLTNKAIIKGYSATAKFASQFSALHPEIIDMTICGGTGGLSILPINSYEGLTLPYPIGVADIPDFNSEEFMKIKHFIYIGEEDNNNPAIPLCEMSDEFDPNGNRLPKKDKEGNLILFRDNEGLLLPRYEDCYTKEQINIIHTLYGDDNQKRFKKNEEIYHELGIDSVHNIYPGNHMTLFENRELIVNDIINFIKSKSLTTEIDSTQKLN